MQGGFMIDGGVHFIAGLRMVKLCSIFSLIFKLK